MQNKIVEKLNETPKLVVPPPPESYQSPPPPPPAAPPPSPPASSAATVAATVLTTGAPTTAVSAAAKPLDLAVYNPGALTMFCYWTASFSRAQYVMNLHNQYGHKSEQEKSGARGQTYTTFGGSQFYQSLFGGKNGFSPLSFLLSGRGGQSPFFVPVPIVVPPPPPPPPGPKCYTNPSVVSVEATEEKFKTSFETIAAHRDFVAKVNFAGDLNCKIEIDGKFILAYATPQKEKEVNIIDANSFFSGDADELFDTSNGTESKPTYIVYGPIR
ncbi:hypothetical protein Y032_0040g318 [Ancylostoma ceylanicum]|uniref:Ground-like domain-containing protein n=1 Tax=Ancylostoma ceylanicum TaxID=53326 RepID=A0A016UJC1_9BILA|nr:hypothetical protein Y032_0040g318 [Ancylostoma ceylanicum]